MSLLDQSGVTGGGLDPYNALFVNMRNMWMEKDLEITIVLFYHYGATLNPVKLSRYRTIAEDRLIVNSVVVNHLNHITCKSTRRSKRC